MFAFPSVISLSTVPELGSASLPIQRLLAPVFKDVPALLPTTVLDATFPLPRPTVTP